MRTLHFYSCCGLFLRLLLFSHQWRQSSCTGQWLHIYQYINLFVAHVHIIWLLTCQNSQSKIYQRTHVNQKRNERKQNWTKYEFREQNERKKIHKLYDSNTYTRRMKRKMQALHGAIWNRQNHNIDCCKFYRAVNLFARHSYSLLQTKLNKYSVIFCLHQNGLKYIEMSRFDNHELVSFETYEYVVNGLKHEMWLL